MLDLLLADIHADYDGLEKILSIATTSDFTEKYGNITKVINLGDILERGTQPKQVIDRLDELQKNYPLISIMGNHDEAFLYKRPVSGSSFESIDAHSKLTEEDLTFFEQNKDGTYGKQLYVDNKNGLFCVHGGPLDPKKITPKNAGQESWLYQRTWQRLTAEDFEYFTYAGYHYKSTSAFAEVQNHLSNFVILCGHQHTEAVLMQSGTNVRDILSSLKPTQEKISRFVVEKKEIAIDPSSNYLIRLGIAGPAGDYKNGALKSYFGIVEYDPKRVTLFKIL